MNRLDDDASLPVRACSSGFNIQGAAIVPSNSSPTPSHKGFSLAPPIRTNASCGSFSTQADRVCLIEAR